MKMILKGIAFILLMFVCHEAGVAKDVKSGTPLECDTVINAEGISAQQIYNNLKVWFADMMRSSNNVIQLDDPQNFHIIGKANISMEVNNLTWSSLSGVIRFTIDVAARDGRFRVKMYDFTHEAFRDGWSEGLVYGGGPNPNIKGLRKKQNSEMQKRALPLCIDNIAMSLATMQESVIHPSSSVDDDW